MERFLLTELSKNDPHILVIDSTPSLLTLHEVFPAHASDIAELVESQSNFLSLAGLFRSAWFASYHEELTKTYESVELAWAELYKRIRSYPVVKRYLAADANLDQQRATCHRTAQLVEQIDEYVLQLQKAYPRFALISKQALLGYYVDIGVFPDLTPLFDYSRLQLGHMDKYEILGVAEHIRVAFPVPLLYSPPNLTSLFAELEESSTSVVKTQIQAKCRRFLKSQTGGSKIFNLQDLLGEMLPQVAEVFLLVQFTMSVEYVVGERLGFTDLMKKEEAILKELHHIVGDRGSVVYSPTFRQRAKRLLFVQYNHCMILKDLAMKPVKACSDPLWWEQVKFYWSDVHQTVLISHRGHDMEYSCELSDGHGQNTGDPIDQALLQSVFEGHRNISLIEVAEGKQDMFDSLIQVGKVIGRKAIAFNCVTQSKAHLHQAIKAAFQTSVMLFLEGFSAISEEDQLDALALFRELAQPFLVDLNSIPLHKIRPLIIVPYSPVIALEDLSVSHFAPHLMCMGLSYEGAEMAVEYLSSMVDAFSPQRFNGRLASKYGDFGNAFLKGISSIIAYLKVDDTVVHGSMSEEAIVALSLHLTLMPRMALQDKPIAQEFLDQQFQRMDLTTILESNYRVAHRLIEDEISKHEIPLFSSVIPLEKQDEEFQQLQLEQRDQYMRTLECALLAQLLFPTLSSQQLEFFSALVIVSEAKGGKSTAFSILSRAFERLVLDGKPSTTHNVTVTGSAEEFIGYLDRLSGRWVDGAFTQVLQKAYVQASNEETAWLVIRMKGPYAPEIMPFLQSALGTTTTTLPAWAKSVQQYYRPLDSKYIKVILLLQQCHVDAFPPECLSSLYILSLEGVCNTHPDHTFETEESITSESAMQAIFDHHAEGEVDGKPFISKWTFKNIWREKEKEFGLTLTDREMDRKLTSYKQVADDILTYEEFCVLWLALLRR